MAEETAEYVTKQQLLTENGVLLALMNDDEVKKAIDSICFFKTEQIIEKLNIIDGIINETLNESIELPVYAIKFVAGKLKIELQMEATRNLFSTLREQLASFPENYRDELEPFFDNLDEILSSPEIMINLKAKIEELSEVVGRIRSEEKKKYFKTFYSGFLKAKHSSLLLETLCEVHNKLVTLHNHLISYFNCNDSEERPMPFIEVKWSVGPHSKKVKSHHNINLASIQPMPTTKTLHLHPYVQLSNLIQENERLRKNLKREKMEVNPEAALFLRQENEKLKEKLRFLQGQMKSAKLRK